MTTTPNIREGRNTPVASSVPIRVVTSPGSTASATPPAIPKGTDKAASVAKKAPGLLFAAKAVCSTAFSTNSKLFPVFLLRLLLIFAVKSLYLFAVEADGLGTKGLMSPMFFKNLLEPKSIKRSALSSATSLATPLKNNWVGYARLRISPVVLPASKKGRLEGTTGVVGNVASSTFLPPKLPTRKPPIPAIAPVKSLAGR